MEWVPLLKDPTTGLLLILFAFVVGIPGLKLLKGGNGHDNGNGNNNLNNHHLTTKELEKELAKLSERLNALDRREQDHWDLVAAARREILDRLSEMMQGFDRDIEHLQRVVGEALQRAKGPRS